MWYIRSFSSSLKPPKLGMDTFAESLADTALANLPIYGILHYASNHDDDVARLKEMQHNEDFRKQLQKNAGYDDEERFQQDMYELEKSYKIHSVSSCIFSVINTMLTVSCLPLIFSIPPEILLIPPFVTASTTFIAFVPSIALFWLFENKSFLELDNESPKITKGGQKAHSKTHNKIDVLGEVSTLTDAHDCCESEISHDFCPAHVVCDM